MYFKVIVAVAAIGVAAARPQYGHGQGQEHGHALSTQSIVLHAGHADEQNAHAQVQLQQDNHHEDHQVDYYAHPKYAYEYKIEDPHTGDKKYQHETRDGDVVKGVYSLHEADGTIRIVEYTADKHSGFNAVVRREGHATHIVPEHNNHY